MRPNFSRREFVLGASSLAASALPTPAQAFLPALVAGIGTIVTLWNGYKMVEELYNRAFKPEQKTLVIRETERVIERPYLVRPDYYGFANPHGFREFGSAEPGCEFFHRSRPQYRGLLCTSRNESIAFASGFVLGLTTAMQALRSRYGEADICAYTRPVEYTRRLEPWSVYGNAGQGFKTEMSYHAPAGSVALQWSVPDRRNPISQGYFRVRDNTSNVIVAEGFTPSFRYEG
jgi:hypothetical protein